MKPTFSVTDLTNVTMKMNDQYNYTIPIYSDFEGSPVTVSYNYNTLSNFVSKLDCNTTKFNPNSFSVIGTHMIEVTLNDSFRLSNYTFTVTVTNTAPYFTVLPSDSNFKMNLTHNFTIDNYTDDESNPVTMTIVSKPDYVTFTKPN